jgi:hypothetical protein
MFKMKESKNKQAITYKIHHALNQAKTELHDNLYVDDQILFKVAQPNNTLSLTIVKMNMV